MKDVKEKWWKRLWNRFIKSCDPMPGMWFFLGALCALGFLVALVDGRPINLRIYYIISFGIMGAANIAIGIYFKLKYRRGKDDTDEKKP